MEGQVCLEGPESQEVTEGQGGLGGSECQGGSNGLGHRKVIIDILEVQEVWEICRQ